MQWFLYFSIVVIVGLAGCSGKSEPVDPTKVTGEVITWLINEQEQTLTWQVKPLGSFNPQSISFSNQTLSNRDEIAIGLANISFDLSNHTVSFTTTITNVAQNKTLGLGATKDNLTFDSVAGGATAGLQVTFPESSNLDLGGDGFLTFQEATEPLKWQIAFSGVTSNSQVLEYAFVIRTTVEYLDRNE